MRAQVFLKRFCVFEVVEMTVDAVDVVDAVEALLLMSDSWTRSRCV